MTAMTMAWLTSRRSRFRAAVWLVAIFAVLSAAPAARADVTVDSVSQSPTNPVTSGQAVTYTFTISSSNTDAANPDYANITVLLGGNDITTQFTPSPPCSSDGPIFCNNPSGIVSGAPQTYSITWNSPAPAVGSRALTFQIACTGGAACAGTSAAITTTVAPPPAPKDDSASTQMNTAVTINVLANDQVQPGQTLTVTAVSTPTHGTAAINGNGTITYTPAAGYTGIDGFSYTAADASQQTYTANVTVAVQTTLQQLPGLTQNQARLAGAFDKLCGGGSGADIQTLCTDIKGLKADQQVTALQQMTPDQLAAQGTTAVQTSTTQLTNIKTRLMSLRQGSSGLSTNGFSLDVTGQSVPAGALLAAGGGGGAGGDLLGDGRLGMFVNGRINFGSRDATGRQSGFDFGTDGVTLGADYRFSNQLVSGVAMGYAATGSTFSGGGKLDASNVTFSTYGSYYLPRDAYVNWIATYGTDSYDTTRDIRFSGVDTHVKGSAGGDQFALSLTGGMDIDRDALLISPYARVEYTSNGVDAYREGGGSALALSYDSQTIESLTTALALRVSRAVSMTWGILSPTAHVEWEHQYENNSRLITAHFAADPSASFSVATDSPDRDYFNLGIGLSVTLPGGRSAFINYETVALQQHITDNTIDLGIRLAF